MWLLAITEELQFRQRRSAVTIHNYEVALKRWAACGVVRTGDVSPESALRFVEARLCTVNVQSVGTEYSALLAVLSHLERTGRYNAARLAEIRRCAPRAPKRKQFSASFLTREQMERYCAGADEEAAFVVRLACFTGLRASELARLTWADVDLACRSLHVRRGKTGARRVSLCEPAIELLKAREAATGRGYASGLVLGGVSARTLQDRVRAGRAASGVRVTLTLCRHSRASWWVQAGVPLAVVAKQLGHSVAVCVTYYAGLVDAYDPVVERGAAG